MNNDCRICSAILHPLGPIPRLTVDESADGKEFEMVRKLLMTTALAASVATALAPSVAQARDHNSSGWQGDRGRGERRDGWDHDGRRGDHWRGDRGRGEYRGYTGGRYYSQPYYGQGYYQDHASYADNGYGGGYYGRPTYRYRCHSDGAAGTIIGAIAGGLLGNGLAGHHDRALGTILGGGAGALAGGAIDRSGNRC